MRNLYDKTKIAKNPGEDEYLTYKNLTSDNLQAKLIEIENFITNLKSECTKNEFEASKYMIENFKPFNDKIDLLTIENKQLRSQVQQLLLMEENKLKEKQKKSQGIF